MIGHGISTETFVVILRSQVPELKLIPGITVFRFDFKVLERHIVLRQIDLDIAAGLEVQVHAFGQIHDELFDEGGDVPV